MAIITSLESVKSRRRVNVYVDGVFGFVIDKKVIANASIILGQEIDEKKINELKNSDLFYRCMDSALSYLSYRPRTESEVLKRLYKCGYTKNIIVGVIKKLKEQKLISDLNFAIYWRDKRLTSNPKAKIMIKYELKQKGISAEIAEKITRNIDDEATAYKAALKRFCSMKFDEYEEFKKKLFNYLKWRGFGYEVVEHISTRLWQEISENV